MIALRKDCSLKDTIKNIKNILKKNNIKVKYKYYSFNNIFFSVRVFLKNFQTIGTNGKGLTKKQALASGLSEFMERLQNKTLILPFFTIKVKENELFFKHTELKDQSDEQKIIIKELLEESKISNAEAIFQVKNYNLYLEYHDVINEKKIFLPYYLIKNLSYTNGMCAGNTYFEAVNQGIFEIFERHCLKNTLYYGQDVNIINKNQLLNLSIYSEIKKIENMGYNVNIIDLSCKIFPVIGVLIERNKDKKYLFACASDFNIDIAIQRCLTEMFQGLKLENIEHKLKSKKLEMVFNYSNFYEAYKNNNAMLPKNFFENRKSINLKNLPFKNVISNQECLNENLKLLEKNNYKIYILDNSILNYPAFQVVIPRLSTINILKLKEIEIQKEIPFLKKCYYNINNLKQDDAKSFVDLLIKINNEYKDFIPNLNTLLKITKFFKQSSNITLLGLALFVSVKYDLDNQEVICNILKIKDKSKLINSVKKLSLQFPTCPNCDKCKIKNNCGYKIWYKMYNKIYTKC